MRQTAQVTGSEHANIALPISFCRGRKLRNMDNSTIRSPRGWLGPTVRTLQGFLVDAEALDNLAADALHFGPHLEVVLEFVVAVDRFKPGRDC